VKREPALFTATLFAAAPAAAARSRGPLHDYEVKATGAKIVSEPGTRVLRLERPRGFDSVALAGTPAP
jgi:hypothetical protein